MATPRPTPRQKRDVSRALAIAKRFRALDAGTVSNAWADELIAILKDLDARTGRRDPSVRAKKKPARTARTSAKRAAKKAGARRR